ncbi:MAG: hypothetical protein JWO42_4063 [Chloroflexi bacterium]|jgi:hypothetical protein|nr:hypothetical protein [Chloroflexota bacterium]MDB5077884.1 hypothetical protein [Chloroflexota bacterium]
MRPGQLIFLVLLLITAGFTVAALPDIQRYLKIRSM